jgi:hypothetical protein
MSTDHQEYSPVFQRQAIAEYARAHSIRIVSDYEDAGISGLTSGANQQPWLLRISIATHCFCRDNVAARRFFSHLEQLSTIAGSCSQQTTGTSLEPEHLPTFDRTARDCKRCQAI